MLMRQLKSRPIVQGLLGLLVIACGETTLTPQSSSGSSQTGTGGTSSSGESSSATGGAPGSGGQGGMAACDDTNCKDPGYACIDGKCVEDCRVPNANPCAPGTVCTAGSEKAGLCVKPDSGCVITNPDEVCGTRVCGPGTRCDLGTMSCIARLPCSNIACAGDRCWGTECPCTRPPAACSPAPLGQPGDAGTLNDPLFSRCGTLGSCSGGIFDLDFDQDCNAFGVTLISGQDFLRRIAPDGSVSEVGGVTNLNMGEVAAIQGKAGTFGGDGLGDQVALTYICCSTCGCQLSGQSGNPQGVAMLDVVGATLPMKIPSTTFTSGSGPWGNKVLDTGPYGLTWGLDRVLYVGNSEKNGEYHALDLTQQSKVLIHTFAQRVLASTPFDKSRMLVAVEGGDVYYAPVLGSAEQTALLIGLGKDVTSLVRDSWSGRIYAELQDGEIVSFGSDGNDLKMFETAPDPGRISIAPDGYLYHLTIGYPTKAAVVRWPLPTTL